MLRIAWLPVFASVILLLSGCTFTHRINPNPKMDEWPEITQIPVHAGVYYSPQFADQEYARKSGSHIWEVQIGAGSVRLFDEILPRVFEKTSQVSNLSADELIAGKIDVVVAPSLEHFDFRTGMNADSDRFSISYRTTLYTPSGVPFASRVVTGDANSKALWTVGSLINDDMSDAALKILHDFESNAAPALAAIAKNSGDQDPSTPLDLQNTVFTAKQTDLPGLDPKQTMALREAGILILEVTAQSEMERELVMRSSDMRLQPKKGIAIEPSSISSVLSLLDKTSQSGAAVAVIFGAPLGVLTTFSEERSKQASREAQFRSGSSSLFEDRTLSKGKMETGIVLFCLPKAMTTAEEMTLAAWVVDPISAQGAQVELPLK